MVNYNYKKKGDGEETEVIKESNEEEEQKESNEEEEQKQDKARRDGGEEEKKEWSEIRLAIQELSVINYGGGRDDEEGDNKLPTLPFLGLARLLIQVLDKIGPTMAVLRLDIRRNIERLEELYMVEPPKYSTLVRIVEKEVREGTARKAESCARAVLWLTRSMDFTIALLQKLEEDSESSLAQIVDAAYNSSLKQWHGWISSAAYKIALKLIPERKIFVSLLIGKGQDYKIFEDEIRSLVQLLQPLLDEIHALMGKLRLDRLKST